MKKIILATFLFIFATSTNAFAHTHLGSSTPAEGEVVTEELREITLNFEGKIEQSSSFELSNTQGENIPVEEISVNEGIMTGTLANPLENGDYLVKYSIIGADGHLMEGEVSFSVNVPESATSSEASNETKQDTAQEVEQNNEQATAEPAEEIESDEETSPVIPVMIIVLLVVVIGAFFVMRRKK